MVVVRRRRARHNAILGLKKAEKAGKLEPRRFYDEAALSLSRYLSDRFTIPEIAVTADTIERTLAEKSVRPEAVKEALTCLQECDFGRFVSASASASKMSDLTARIRRVIDTMERT